MRSRVSICPPSDGAIRWRFCGSCGKVVSRPTRSTSGSRGIGALSNGLIESKLVAHSEASYIKLVCVTVGGAPFDEVVLDQTANRWYLANVPPAGSDFCRQVGKSGGP